MTDRERLPYFYEGIAESPIPYDNPSRDVSVTAEFTSPSGGVRKVEAFWDGGRIWRFRIDADEPGMWSYSLRASDGTGDDWLGGKGDVAVSPYAGPNPFYRHGPLRASEDGTHIIHRDGTPFFWLADTTWNSVLRAEPKDWDSFLRRRKQQGFTAMQCVMTNWRAYPADTEGERAYEGDENIRINPDFFRRLDANVAAVARHGLVPALVVLWALTPRDPGNYLSEADAVALARYIVARYGAYRPTWFLGGDGRYMNDVDRWKRIGQAVFKNAGEDRALTTLHPCGTSWTGEAFRDEHWFDFIGYQSSHGADTKKSFGWIVHGEPAKEWENAPQLPVINLEPCYELHKKVGTDERWSAHDVRIACYYSLLASPTAGITYGHGSIWPWGDHYESPLDHRGAGVSPAWYDVVDSPGAASMSCLRWAFERIAWWKLRPAPELLARRPDQEEEMRFVPASRADDGSVAVVYLPHGGEIPLRTDSLEHLDSAVWIDPRTGERREAPAPTGGQQVYKSPGKGDWLLVIGG